MPEAADMSYAECRLRLGSGAIGRVAVSTPVGPRIVPVNYMVLDDAVVFRAPAYSLLGTYARNSTLAFEVDAVQVELREGWSVAAVGRAAVVEDPAELRRISEAWDPKPWNEGERSLVFRLPWTELSGRRLGGSAA